jgi:formyl-CoA transferase
VTAEAGVLALNRHQGDRPVLGGVPYTDISTALNAAIAMLAALRARDHSGLGQHVDVAMFDTALANLSFRGCEFLASGREPEPNERQTALPRGMFDTADGSIVITCAGDKMFRALCLNVVDRPDWLEDSRFNTMTERLQHGEDFLAAIGTVFKSQPSAIWSERCKRANIPCGAVRTVGEALLSAEAQERGLVFGVPHPAAGAAPAIAQPFRFSRTPCDYRAPPLLGQHTREVLAALPTYAGERIEALAKTGAIRLADKREEQ